MPFADISKRASGLIFQLRHSHSASAILLAVLLTIAGCSDATEPGAPHATADAQPREADDAAEVQPYPLRFVDVTAESGIDMILTSGELPSTQILEVKGNGLALLDYNNDGRLDVFVPNGATLADPEHGPGWRLYKNLGAMRFEDVTAQAGITHTRWAYGAAVGDFDSDGYADLYVTCYGPNVLLRNTGDGRFEDVTEAAGVGNDRWSTSASFGDVTGDGRLDLYVANYIEFDAADPPPSGQFLGTTVFAGPHGLPAAADVLYANQGDGTFADITEESGCSAVSPAWGLGAVILDFTGDGLQDIYVGNDSMRNFLFANQGDGTFRDIGLESGVGANAAGNYQATMGIGIADVIGNGLPALLTTNFSSDMNTLHVNTGDGRFEDYTNQLGLGVISRPFLGWACGFFDLNLDGNEELLIVNGHIYPQATLELLDSQYEQTPLLFARARGKAPRYERVEHPGVGDWLHTPRRDRAVVFGDLDDNGTIDLLIGEMNGPILVLRNDSDVQGDWLIVELRDDRPNAHNRRGLGSQLDLFVGTQRYTRWIYSGGFLSANPQSAHFGIGQAFGDTERHSLMLRITWPDGYVQELHDVDRNQRMVVSRVALP